MRKLRRFLYNLLKRGNKPWLIDIRDYPRSKYSTYFEYFVDRTTFAWLVRIIDVQTSKVLESKSGGADSYYKASGTAQREIKRAMEKYRR